MYMVKGGIVFLDVGWAEPLASSFLHSSRMGKRESQDPGVRVIG